MLIEAHEAITYHFEDTVAVFLENPRIQRTAQMRRRITLRSFITDSMNKILSSLQMDIEISMAF